MAQRKSWSKQEDKLLILLRLERRVQKWCDIAEIMRLQYGIQGRNGKQCRERFHNHLDSSITKSEWRMEQDMKLVQLHNEMGNRWAQIARQISGRTDNCVKNRFYTKFRRSIRLINQCIRSLWKKQFKPLKQSIISKIIEFSAKNSVPPNKNKQNSIKTCEDLKTRLFLINQQKLQEVKKNGKQNQLLKLLQDIVQFNRDNRRRGKKKKIVLSNCFQQPDPEIKQEGSLNNQSNFEPENHSQQPEQPNSRPLFQDRNDEESQTQKIKRQIIHKDNQRGEQQNQILQGSPFGGLSELSGLGSPARQRFLYMQQNFLEIKQVESEINPANEWGIDDFY